MNFAERFKVARMQTGLSQDKLSAELGISKRTIINYEKGNTLPPSDKILEIARYFGVSIESLITEDEEFATPIYEQAGSKGKREANALVNEISGFFAGESISDEDKDAVMRAIQNAYWVAKEENKPKYTTLKYREAMQEE